MKNEDMMTIDDISVTRALFHPRPESDGYMPVGVATVTQVEGAELGGYLHENKASNALLVFFHGNGETAIDYDSIAPIYTQCGLSCWITDYRGYGRSTGTPSFSLMLKDAEAVLADVANLGKSIGRSFGPVIVMGRSLGSAPAIHLASLHESQISGIVLDSPYADGLALIQRLGGLLISRQDIPMFDDNIDKMRCCRQPTLIIHGTADRIIPIADAEALLSQCMAEKKHLVRIKDAGHNNLFSVGAKEYCAALRNYFARVIGFI